MIRRRAGRDAPEEVGPANPEPLPVQHVVVDERHLITVPWAQAFDRFGRWLTTFEGRPVLGIPQLRQIMPVGDPKVEITVPVWIPNGTPAMLSCELWAPWTSGTPTLTFSSAWQPARPLVSITNVNPPSLLNEVWKMVVAVEGSDPAAAPYVLFEAGPLGPVPPFGVLVAERYDAPLVIGGAVQPNDYKGEFVTLTIAPWKMTFRGGILVEVVPV